MNELFQHQSKSMKEYCVVVDQKRNVAYLSVNEELPDITKAWVDTKPIEPKWCPMEKSCGIPSLYKKGLQPKYVFYITHSVIQMRNPYRIN